jgi:tripartite ATP-independent transporter DctM subunit
MSPVTVGFIGFIVLFALFAIGLPVGVSMAIVGFGGLWYLISQDAAIAKMGLTSFEVVANWDLATLPLFILMAQVVFAAGLNEDLYNLTRKWLGHLRGGIAMATIGACAVFAAISASAVATAATMGMVAIPEMKKCKYDPALATGCIAAGGTIGVLIPPSGPFIIYGLLTGTSIGKLFIAGIVPGVLQAIFYIVTIYILCRRNPNFGPPGPRYSLRERVAAFWKCGEIIMLILLILVGITVGWFTPTEGGAVGAFGAIVFSLFRRRLNWEKFKNALIETLKTSGMIYGILIGAFIFMYFMAVTTIPFALIDFVSGLHLPPLGVMGCIIVLYVVLGSAMEEASMMVLTIPILFPLVVGLGFDPIWFGILTTRMEQIGMISPPVGITMFVTQGISKEPITTIYRGVIPFLLADVVHVALLVFIPSIALFLPGLMMR